MRLHAFWGELPLGAFEHCGDGRIRPQGGGIPIVSDVVDVVGDVVGGAVDAVVDVVNDIPVVGDIADDQLGLDPNGGGMVPAIKGVGTSLATAALGAPLMGELGGFASDLVGGAGDFLGGAGDIVGGLGDAASGAWDAVSGVADDIVGGVGDAASGAWDGVSGAVGDVPDFLGGVSSDVVGGSPIGDVGTSLSDVFAGASENALMPWEGLDTSQVFEQVFDDGTKIFTDGSGNVLGGIDTSGSAFDPSGYLGSGEALGGVPEINFGGNLASPEDVQRLLDYNASYGANAGGNSSSSGGGGQQTQGGQRNLGQNLKTGTNLLSSLTGKGLLGAGLMGAALASGSGNKGVQGPPPVNPALLKGMPNYYLDRSLNTPVAKLDEAGNPVMEGDQAVMARPGYRPNYFVDQNEGQRNYFNYNNPNSQWAYAAPGKQVGQNTPAGGLASQVTPASTPASSAPDANLTQATQVNQAPLPPDAMAQTTPAKRGGLMEFADGGDVGDSQGENRLEDRLAPPIESEDAMHQALYQAPIPMSAQPAGPARPQIPQNQGPMPQQKTDIGKLPPWILGKLGMQLGAQATMPQQAMQQQRMQQGMARGGLAQATRAPISDWELEAIKRGGFAHGGEMGMLEGEGDGVSDDIPAMIGSRQPARLSGGEFVIPARIVSEIGNGSSDAGADRLYRMMDRINQRRLSSKDFAKNTRSYEELPE